MEIVLDYVPPGEAPKGWTAVGRVDGDVLAYDTERRPHRVVEDRVPEALDPAAVNARIRYSLEVAAMRLWGENWQAGMCDSFGINRRTIQTDKLTRQGLHPRLLAEVGRLASDQDAREMGELLRALGRYVDSYGDPSDLDAARRGADNAIAVLSRVRSAGSRLLTRLRDGER